MDCPIPIETDKGYVYKKPIEMITPLSWEYIKAFGFYEKHWYPNGNIGWLNEGNKFVEAMSIMDNEMGSIKKESDKNG